MTYTILVPVVAGIESSMPKLYNDTILTTTRSSTISGVIDEYKTLGDLVATWYKYIKTEVNATMHVLKVMPTTAQ